MDLMLADLAALALVAAAAGYLARRAIAANRRRGCAGCGPTQQGPAAQRIDLQQLRHGRRR